MLTPHIKNEPETQVPYQHQWWEMPEPGIASPFLQQPPLPPVSPKRRAGALRTGVMVVLTLLLAVIFSVGLFAGWQFGRTSTVAGGTSTVNKSTAVQATSTVETAQEAAIAK
jgi:hypothetical protein